VLLMICWSLLSGQPQQCREDLVDWSADSSLQQGQPQWLTQALICGHGAFWRERIVMALKTHMIPASNIEMALFKRSTGY
jgi:hypothetical protein